MPPPPPAALPREQPAVAPVAGVLLCPPKHFEVRDTKNDFMVGQQGRVKPDVAAARWRDLVSVYRAEGLAVETLDPRPGAEDMVFTANPSALLPARDGGWVALLSRMRHPSRQAEVAGHDAWWRARGLAPRTLPAEAGHFEGHGDLLLVPGRAFALLGVGGRSEASALPHLRALGGCPIEPLPLVGRPFYHLDTALAVLDDSSVLVHPPAFRPEALASLRRLFERVLEADAEEAATRLACNAHALPAGRVLVPAGAPRTADVLARAGYAPRLVDVSEFERSGGSLFCLKLELPADLPGASA